MSAASSKEFVRGCRVLASAGSGKTYQLTSRYLDLLARGAEPSGILATTFTRAAAGEIRNRIMMRLVESVHDAKKRAALGDSIGRKKMTAEDVVTLLRTITDNLHRLQIRTLDSFFASIVQTFALDLGLSDGCKIVEENEIVALRDEAIALLLDEDNPQPMIDLLRHLTTTDGGRSVHDTIDRQIVDLYELFQETQPDAWDAIAPPTGRLTEAELIDAIQQLRAIQLPKHKSIPPQHEKCCNQAEQKQWQHFLKGGYPEYILAGKTEYYSRPIEPGVLNAYQPLIQHARAEIIERERRRNQAAHRLLTLFDQHFKTLKHRDGVVNFSDLSPKLSELFRNGDQSEHDIDRFMEICFRLDGTVDHLLLDEFQDTSITQWKAMQPIVAEIMAGEGDRVRSFYCVGDVKQSIYGWRHASPEILENLHCLIHEDGSPADIHNDYLAKSWRSSPTIIECVNRVFGNLPRNEAMKEYSGVAQRWQSDFKKHETEKKTLPGYIELRMMERAGKAEALQSQRWKAAARLAADLYRRSPDLSIAILTRKNKAAARLLFELGPDCPEPLDVPAGGRGKGSLTDAPVIEALLDLLSLADHPDDTIAAWHIANSPAAELIDISPDFAARANWKQRAEVSRKLRDAFSEHGYASTIAAWMPTLAPSCTAREIARLQQFIEAAERYDASGGGGGRADQFIKLIEQSDIPDVRPAPIQVMTVHKAKGLEFDAVILPELEATLGGKPPKVVYERDGATGPIMRICRYIKKELQPLVPELAPMFQSATERTVRESLCFLYVAITRAKHGLYMFVDPLSEKEPKISPSLSGIMIGTYADEQAQPGNVLYQDGIADWVEQLEAKTPSAPRETVRVTTPIQLPKAKRRATKTADAPSQHLDDSSVHAQRRNAEADDRGTAMHALLQQIEWLDGDGLLIDSNSCDRLVERAARGRDAAWRGHVIDEFQSVLQNPNLKSLLTRSDQIGDADTIDVHRELSFARLVRGAAQRGSIDRLVVRRKNGKIIGAEVIDFKTDRLRATDDAEQHAQRYAAQLDDYRGAAAKLLRIDPALIERFVFFVTIDRAVRLK